MFVFLSFLTLIFSMSHAPCPPQVPIASFLATSQPATPISDIDRFQQAGIYAVSECPNCSTTTFTSAAR